MFVSTDNASCFLSASFQTLYKTGLLYNNFFKVFGLKNNYPFIQCLEKGWKMKSVLISTGSMLEMFSIVVDVKSNCCKSQDKADKGLIWSSRAGTVHFFFVFA